MSRLDTFDPNTAPDPWATYCPGRYNGGTFKTHTQRGHAVSALNNQGEGILYEFVDGRWQEVTRRDMEKAPKHCMGCGVGGHPVPSSRYCGDRTKEYLYGVFARVSRNGRLQEPLNIVWLCRECK